MNTENTVNDVQGAVVAYPEALKAVNDAGAGAVHLQNPEGYTSEGVPVQPGAEAVAKPHQSAEENARFAEMRRQLDSYKARYSALENTVNEILPGLNGYGLEGNSLEEIALALKANEEGISPEELIARENRREAELKKAIDSDPRILEAERITKESQYSKDLEAVKTAFPEVKANSVYELGDVFLRSMAAGLSPEDAYAAQLNHNKRTIKPTPPKIGTVTQSFEPEKEYLSDDELNSLTKEQLVKNPKLLEKAMRSMTKK